MDVFCFFTIHFGDVVKMTPSFQIVVIVGISELRLQTSHKTVIWPNDLKTFLT